jgi:hypothetical protein
MKHQGYVDGNNGTTIWGWVYDPLDVSRELKLDIYADDVKIETITSGQFREDLKSNGIGNGNHAFSYAIPAAILGRKILIKIHQTACELQSSSSAEVTKRQHYWFTHSLERGFPSVASGFGTAEISARDVEICARLIKAHRSASKDDPRQSASVGMWQHIQDTCHGEMLNLIRNDNASALAAYLLEMYRKPVTHGFMQGLDRYNALVSNPSLRQFAATQYVDRLASFAEAVGYRPVECAEQMGGWCENLFADVNDLEQGISSRLGISIVPPQIANGLFGILTRNGLLHSRDLDGAYAAWRIAHILKQNPDASVCEIGAGVGGVAYFACKFGIRNYTIIDLVNVNTVQGYYLMKTLPDANVVLYGETQANSNSIRVLPTWCHKQAPDNSFDLTFNQDSFPEMGSEIALEYLEQIKRNTRSFLFSINQESQAGLSAAERQGWMAKWAQQAQGYEQIYRFRHWLRNGYVEELFKIQR